MILSVEKPKHRTIDNYNETKQHFKLVCRPQLTLHIQQQQQMQFKHHNSQFFVLMKNPSTHANKSNNIFLDSGKGVIFC